MGESIGKEKDVDGKVVNTGITPMVSIGSTDLHSVAQLYLGGPKDKTTTFISTRSDLNVSVPEELSWNGLADIIKGKPLNEVIHAELSGTQIAYIKRGLSETGIGLITLTSYSGSRRPRRFLSWQGGKICWSKTG